MHFFQGLLFNLAGAFAGDVVFIADFLKCQRVISHDSVLDDKAFPFTEIGQRAGDVTFDQASFLILYQGYFLIITVVCEKIKMRRFTIIIDEFV